MNARLTLLVLGVAVTISGTAAPDAATGWRLAKTVSTGTGSTFDYVVVPEEKQGDLGYLREIANTICGTRIQCMVFFWADPRNLPESAWLDGKAMTTLSATYERHPNYREPHLRLACWHYPSKQAGEKDSCIYMPGARVPPSK